MAMADTTPSKVYDIAEQLGYEGARTQSSAKAVYACADALGFVGPHARRITDALTDLKSVVGGGGGGVDLGKAFELTMHDNSDKPLGCAVEGVSFELAVPLVVGIADRLPSGAEYLLVEMVDENGDEVTITDATQVSASIKVGGGAPSAFTDFEVVDSYGINAIQFSVDAISTEDTQLQFIITPDI